MLPGQGDHPPSFHYEYSDDWARWVLDHGLPALPDVLCDDDEVPIAYWAGPAFGAALFRSWSSPRGEETGHTQPDVNNDHHAYIRTEARWEATGGTGGSAGPNDNPMRPGDYPERLAHFIGEWQDGPVRGVTGVVGAAARTIELIDGHGRTCRPVQAPLGWVIVCFDALDEVTIRVLDSDDEALLGAARTPGRW
jgi:hypothetical protein